MTATLHFRRLNAEYWQPIYERQQLFLEMVEWDENKRQKVLRERRVDFENVKDALEKDENLISNLEPDSMKRHGELRYRFIGQGKDRIYEGVYTERDGIRRLITCWKAGIQARRKYNAK